MNWRSILTEHIEQFEERSGTSPFKEILALAWLIGEVENGGFIQYLENEAGAGFQPARDAAVSVGNPDVGSLLDSIASRFPDGLVPADPHARHLAIETLCDQTAGKDPFDGETSRFWVLQPGLEANMNRWLQAHGAEVCSESFTDPTWSRRG